MGKFHEDKVYGILIRESADDGSDFATPPADYRVQFVGEDGNIHLKDSSDVVTDFPAGGGGGGGGGWTEISSTTLGSNAASHTFSSIPNTYTDLLVVARARSDAAGVVGDDMLMRVGAGTVDSGTNYSHGGLSYGDATFSTREANGQTAWGDGVMGAVSVTGASANAGLFGYLRAEIYDYADPTFPRWTIWRGSMKSGASVTRGNQLHGVWDNTSDAIDIITLLPDIGSNFVTGSKFVLLGR